jgi:hypothetical protein
MLVVLLVVVDVAVLYIVNRYANSENEDLQVVVLVVLFIVVDVAEPR